MRTIIELDERQISALEALRKKEKTSRAQVIREAVDAYIQNAKMKNWQNRPAFAAWKGKPRDGIMLQRKLRAEWDR